MIETIDYVYSLQNLRIAYAILCPLYNVSESSPAVHGKWKHIPLISLRNLVTDVHMDGRNSSVLLLHLFFYYSDCSDSSRICSPLKDLSLLSTATSAMSKSQHQ